MVNVIFILTYVDFGNIIFHNIYIEREMEVPCMPKPLPKKQAIQKKKKNVENILKNRDQGTDKETTA